MQSNNFLKAFILTIILVVGFMAGLEYYWRHRGFTVSYNDDKVLWTNERKKVYKPADQLTVFAGGSRIKFDLDIRTWEKETGEDAVQLALVRTPGRLVLHNLANDENFKGKLIIDIAEQQFFGTDTTRRDKSAREAIDYYHDETPAQNASAFLDFKVESKLVFLEEGKFGLTAILNRLNIKNRPGVVLPNNFPPEFSQVNFDRQNYMTPMFLSSQQLRNTQIGNWKRGIAAFSKTPMLKGDTLITFLKKIKASIDKIKSRGGTVLFVRPPSSGEYQVIENKLFPREKYWDLLLKYTDSPGIHFEDYPETAHFVCPEISHLSPNDAVVYTRALIRILKEEKGWVFANNK